VALRSFSAYKRETVLRGATPARSYNWVRLPRKAFNRGARRIWLSSVRKGLFSYAGKNLFLHPRVEEANPARLLIRSCVQECIKGRFLKTWGAKPPTPPSMALWRRPLAGAERSASRAFARGQSTTRTILGCACGVAVDPHLGGCGDLYTEKSFPRVLRNILNANWSKCLLIRPRLVWVTDKC
jgi:hypothetical protein